MIAAQSRPEVEKALAGLKDFQRATVDYAFRRLWTDPEPTKRFLVADEVGLGKTLVAKGVIARTVEHLWETVERIDIVYICSNQQIARQNLSRLNVVNGQSLDHADRLTMLPTVIRSMNENRVNFVSFTPGTSFRVAGGGGRAAERVVLYWMLAAVLGHQHVAPRRWVRYFQGGVAREDTFRTQLQAFDRRSLDHVVTEAFGRELATSIGPGDGPLLEELEACVAEFNYLRGSPGPQLASRRYWIIGALRSAVARASVAALEPDLVIMDEFQRFKDLLVPGTDASELAHALFDHPDARVLLLSATPYKMYTLPDEPEGDDHYRDFISTFSFLADDDRAARVKEDLRAMRTALVAGTATEDGPAARDRVQAELRRVMCRTERLAATPNRDGMLREAAMPARPTTGDVRALRGLDRVAQSLGSHDTFEYWRSAPYILNVMEHTGYKVKRDLVDRQDDPTVARALSRAEGLLSGADLDAYRAIDPGNAKMRGLMTDVLDRDAWRLAWLPPSLPYYERSGAYADPRLTAFTKRLVFSAWSVVPKAIAVVLSYEAERRAVEASGRDPGRYSDRRKTALLQYRLDGERPAGMPTLALCYPSATLARLGDPLTVARAVCDYLPAPRAAVVAEVRRRVERELAALPEGQAGLTATADQRWYWAAPILMDRCDAPLAQAAFERIMPAWAGWDTDDVHRGLAAHVRAATSVTAEGLGRRPDDLVDVLTGLALAGPGTCGLRALSRVCGGVAALQDPTVRDRAFEISTGLRSLFNRPEIMTLLAADGESEDSYWRRVLEHCADGGLQAVLDEYVHVLLESEGLQDHTANDRAKDVAAVINESLSLVTASNNLDDFRVSDAGFEIDRYSVRAHLAARFGRTQADDKTVIRESNVRTAFNSPFWPFVLASTSVGQEGLDFHTNCHAVVHWNLPSNPVDLEQREGRVHRYKGHAVRKNVAMRHADAAFHASGDDPWSAMFDAAAEERPEGGNEITPCWIYPATKSSDGGAPDGRALIERYVPAVALSHEVQQYRRLRRTVGSYRLVFGQPRQEDLVEYLGRNDADLSWMRIDLAPPEG